ncbi:hypothetical protein BsWGS_26484 [Bradybaena similaris]
MAAHSVCALIQVSNSPASSLRVFIICVDADVQDKVKVHPNGLIGVGCHHGLYDMRHPVNAGTQGTSTIVIPYIRIERLKLKKNNQQTIREELETRMSYLPSPYREHFTGQCAGVASSSKDVDTSKVRLAVIISCEGCSGWLEKLWDVSNVIKDASQKTSLGILKLSRSQVPASTGAWVDVFTTDNSPLITAGEYLLHVTHQPSGDSGKLEHWMSQDTIPGEDCIIYNKVISYKVPPFEPNLYLKAPVKAALHLVCPESNLSCFCDFLYVPERATTKIQPQTDGGVNLNTSPDRWRSAKRSRCDSFQDGQITGSLKIKSAFQGDTTYPVKYNGPVASEPDYSPLSTDTQMSNAEVAVVDTPRSTNMVKLLPAPGTDESKTANIIWMKSTSVHQDSQTGSNNCMRPTSVHQDSQTGSNNRMRPTSVHQDSQTGSKNRMRPTSVHQDSQTGSNNRMRPTSVHQDSQTGSNNRMRPTSVHQDSQTGSNNRMRPTSVHQDSQTGSNNRMRPTSVHQDSQAAHNCMRPTSVHQDSQEATLPHNNVKTESEFTENGIYMGNYQSMSFGFGRSSSVYPNILNEQHDSFVQEKGASSRVQSTPSYIVQQPIPDVPVNAGRDIKLGRSNPQQLLTKHSQLVPQRAAWHDASGTSLPFQNRATTNIPQHLKDAQSAELIES